MSNQPLSNDGPPLPLAFARCVLLGCVLAATTGCSGSENDQDRSVGTTLGAQPPREAEQPGAGAMLGSDSRRDPDATALPPRPDLSHLLQLPPGAGEVDRIAERLKPDGEDRPETVPGKKRRPLRLGVDRDVPAEALNTKRERVDVGAALDVAGSTSVRGGFRVEKESGQRREKPLPTVGVEIRY